MPPALMGGTYYRRPRGGARVSGEHIGGIVNAQIDPGASDQEGKHHRAGPNHCPVEEPPGRLDQDLGQREIKTERDEGMAAWKTEAVRQRVVEVRLRADALEHQLHGLLDNTGA